MLKVHCMLLRIDMPEDMQEGQHFCSTSRIDAC